MLLMDMDCLSNIYDPVVYDPRYYDLVAYYDNGLLSCDPDYLAHYLMRKGNRYMVYITGGPGCWLSIDGQPVRMIRPQTEAQAWAWLRRHHNKLCHLDRRQWMRLFSGYVMGMY